MRDGAGGVTSQLVARSLDGAPRPWTLIDWACTRTALRGEFQAPGAGGGSSAANGRPVNDPLGTTTIAMPPKGFNPALSDKDIRAAVAYLRTLNKAS